MEQKTANEFPGTERHLCDSVAVLPIFIAECHLPIFYLFDSVIADGNFMRVTAKVLQHLLRSGKRFLGINNPGLFPGQMYEFVALFRQLQLC